MTDQFVAERFSDWALALKVDDVPGAALTKSRQALTDHVGLCVSARRESYVDAALKSWDGRGACTAFGHAEGFDAGGAALINGLSAHGEDYDDTFEGQPVHTSVAIMPAVLAACERDDRTAADAVRGMVVGSEFMCRMGLVSPMAIHKAGFHPTAVIGALGAAAAVSASLGLDARQMTNALGTAGSMASGIIEYLAEGTWTKRLHPGWAAQAGLRAALLAAHGFVGPRSVIEGEHGFFKAFGTGSIPCDFTQMTEGLGERFVMQQIALKPYACGTMTQPFIDCAIGLAREGVDPDAIESVLCRVGEGTVHRLWEPLAEKRNPSSPYSAKFSVPYCVAVGLLDQAAGLGQFTEARMSDRRLLNLAAKVGYEIDPEDEYPRNYTGDVEIGLRDGATRRLHQPYMRGGAREPLDDVEVESKFDANLAYGGASQEAGEGLKKAIATLFADGGCAVRGLFEKEL